MEQAAGISITIPKAVVAEIIMEKLNGLGVDSPRRIFEHSPRRVAPTIGAAFEGGIYAGITVHDDMVYALVLLPGEKESVGWKDAMHWADCDLGRAQLPSRFDMLVLLKNLKKEFQDQWYWTSEQHASDESCAWMQNFGSGDQGYGRKGSGYRARAVRRVAI